MQRSTIIGEVVIACLLTLLTVIALVFFNVFFSSYSARAVTIALVGIAYTGTLIARCKDSSGTLLLGLLAVAAHIVALMVSFSLTEQGLLATAIIWGHRSLMLYRSMMASFADGLVSVTSAVAGLVGGLLLFGLPGAVWCFFLVQCLHVYIPNKFDNSSEMATSIPTDRFSQAARAALEAMDSAAFRK